MNIGENTLKGIMYLPAVDLIRKSEKALKHINCSGLYDCDMERVVSKASEIIEKERP